MITIIGPQSLPPVTLLQNTETAAAPGGFTQVLEQVNGALQQADQLAASYAQGKAGLTQAVVASEQADTSFQVLMAIRNRALAAYQEIMNLQV